MNSTDNKINLESIVFAGRNLEEHVQMFNLDLSSFPKTTRFLHSPAGASSFTREMNRAGFHCVGVDILYDFDTEILRDRCESDLRRMRQAFSKWDDVYKNKLHIDTEKILDGRRRTTEIFLDDFSEGKKSGRYVMAKLPLLPFEDESFDIVLSSHFFFLYNAHLDFTFHQKAFSEMIRVAKKEIRIFPIESLETAQTLLLEKIIDCLIGQNLKVDLFKVKTGPLQIENHLMVIQLQKTSKK